MNISTLLFFAGVGQIILVLGSLAIPRILHWKQELAKVEPLIQQIFWTYAGYILVTNFSFGIISVFAGEVLTDGSTLATAVTGFITLYWFSRIIIQFFYFERKNFPKGTIHNIGEVLLVALFVYLIIVYGYAFYLNILK